MKKLCLTAIGHSDLGALRDKFRDISPHLLIVMGATGVMSNEAFFKGLAQSFPDTAIMGCSTSGEISPLGVSDRGLLITGVHFDKSTVRLEGVDLADEKESEEAAQSMTFAGDIPMNSEICLMHASTEALADGATAAAQDAVSQALAPSGDRLALLVSCVGRRLVMGEDADAEIENARAVLGEDAGICGFYSYGEISPFPLTGQAELHNQTMTITTIFETA